MSTAVLASSCSSEGLPPYYGNDDFNASTEATALLDKLSSPFEFMDGHADTLNPLCSSSAPPLGPDTPMETHDFLSAVHDIDINSFVAAPPPPEDGSNELAVLTWCNVDTTDADADADAVPPVAPKLLPRTSPVKMNAPPVALRVPETIPECGDETTNTDTGDVVVTDDDVRLFDIATFVLPAGSDGRERVLMEGIKRASNTRDRWVTSMELCEGKAVEFEAKRSAMKVEWNGHINKMLQIENRKLEVNKRLLEIREEFEMLRKESEGMGVEWETREKKCNVLNLTYPPVKAACEQVEARRQTASDALEGVERFLDENTRELLLLVGNKRQRRA